MTRYRLLLEALTPIAHGDTRTGIDNPTNIRLFMTQPTTANGRLVYAPHISENALRTAMLRRPLADHLLTTLGVDPGSLSRAVLALLYSGGNMGHGRTPGDEAVLGHMLKRLYPSLDLLGGAVDTFIIPRSRLRMSAWLVAQEYLTPIETLFPELAGTARTISAYDLIGQETRTRGTGEKAGGNQMLYTYQVLAAGARIVIEFTIDSWTPQPTVGALARGVAEWDGFIGGQGRQGKGRCRAEWISAAPALESYDRHLTDNADALRAGILDGSLGTGKTLCAA